MKLYQIIPRPQILKVYITLLSNLRANFIFLRLSLATATILFSLDLQLVTDTKSSSNFRVMLIFAAIFCLFSLDI